MVSSDPIERQRKLQAANEPTTTQTKALKNGSPKYYNDTTIRDSNAMEPYEIGVLDKTCSQHATISCDCVLRISILEPQICRKTFSLWFGKMSLAP